jgi:hypothetical protein
MKYDLALNDNGILPAIPILKQTGDMGSNK